jgi:2-dehydro-3-deoxyglucarate aldolase/4-hydroxy-2-oxoheptanedioate aldolase
VVQVETLGALDELDEIAAIEGVDVLFVGPGDLSYALGVPGQLTDARYLEALESVLGACASGGCSPGLLVRNAAEAQRYLEMGFRFIGVGSDAAFVMAAGSAIVDDFRQASPVRSG